MPKLYKILRVTAWILTLLIPVAIFSGFFMARNFLVPWVDYATSAKIHGFLILLALLPALYLHSLAGILISIQRHPALNKKYLKMLIAIVWTAMLALMVFFLFAQPPAQTTVNPSNQAASQTQQTPMETTSVKKYTMAEIATRDTPEDCWLLINGKIYDVTKNITQHPGGEKNISDMCGKESTAAFDTKNENTPHSPNANEMLKDLLIGELAV